MGVCDIGACTCMYIYGSHRVCVIGARVCVCTCTCMWVCACVTLVCTCMITVVYV